MAVNGTGSDSLPSASVEAVATISTVGLALSLGIATIIPATWKLLTELKPHEIRRSRPMRMMRNFARWRYIALFFILALIHMTAGFSVMLYLDTSLTQFLTVGQYVVTVAMALTIAAIVFVLVSAHAYSQQDIDEEAKAQSVLLQSLKFVCKCGNVNPLVPNCPKCGEPTGYVEVATTR